MAPSSEVTLDALRCVFIFMLRSYELVSAAIDVIRPECFLNVGVERGHAVLFNILSTYYKTYKTLPAYNVLMVETQKFFNAYPTVLSAEAAQEMMNIIYWAHHSYTNEQVQQNTPWAKTVLQEFVMERTVTIPMRQAIAANRPTSEIMKIMSVNMEAAQRVSLVQDVDPFDTFSDVVKSLQPTGCRWFDLLSGGGFYQGGGHVTAFIGPTGVGKTIAAVDLCASLVRRNETVLYITYELPVLGAPGAETELTYRMLANVLEYDKAKLEAQGRTGVPAEIQQKFVKMQQLMKGRFRCLDLSGAVPGHGHGGTAEIEKYLNSYAQQGVYPRLVVIDFFDLMRDRMTMTNKNFGAVSVSRAVSQMIVSDLVRIATKYRTNFFCLHQADTEACKRPYYVRPTQADAADVKNCINLMQLVISTSTPHVVMEPIPGNDYRKATLCLFAAVKDRLGRGLGEVIVERYGPVQRWVSREDYMFQSSTKSFEQVGTDSAMAAPS